MRVGRVTQLAMLLGIDIEVCKYNKGQNGHVFC
jgi:hypothetical protein